MTKSNGTSTPDLSQLDPHNMPQHVALIMDGNGRWANQRLKPRLFGHKHGMQALKRAIDYALQAKIPYLSAWAFSTANWKRPQSEITGLLSLLRSTLTNDIDEFHEKNIRLHVVGFLDALPQDIQNLIKDSVEKTKDNTALTLIIQFNYDGRRDLLEAIKSLSLEDIKSLTEPDLASKTMMGNYPEPELMIRTSNVIRLSNYMMWQLAFTEFVFLEKHWPDFNQDDFHQALMNYQGLDRRFGKSAC